MAKALIIDDMQRAEGALAEMAAIDGKLAKAEIDMNKAIEAARTKAGEVGTPLLHRRKELEAALKSYAKRQKSVLFTGKQSLDLGFGTIGYRGSKKLVQMDGLKQAFTLQKLKDLGFTEAIAVKESVAREKMEKWPEERLELVGVRWKESTSYFVEVNKEKISSL